MSQPELAIVIGAARGGRAEFHVWPDWFLGFDLDVSTARVSLAARRARLSWPRRLLA